MLKVFIPKIEMRVYFSTYHLWAAGEFAETAARLEKRAKQIPAFDIKHRAYATNSVLSAVAFMEAAINELYQDAADNHESYIKTLPTSSVRALAEFWNLTDQGKLRLLAKYQTALLLAGLPPFDQGAQPYQDAALVVGLRNALVHFRPETLGDDDPHTLTKRLRGKFAENPLMVRSGNPYFPDKCLGSPCALWVARASRAFADEFFKNLSIKPN